MTRYLLALLLALSSAQAAVHYIRASATNEANFKLTVTTTTSPQDFICKFESPATLHVDWGDSSSDDFNASITNTHVYASAGVHTITLSGHVHLIDLFAYPGLGTPLLLSTINGQINGIDGLVSAYEMFKGCGNITSVPTGLFDKCTNITTFYDSFLNCAKLVSIPNAIFDKCTNVTTFYATFDNCDIITSIPDDLFRNQSNNLNFAWVFAKCYALTTIPENLFDHNTKVTSFDHAFYRCYALTNIPSMLFNENPLVTTYAYAFEDCTALIGHSPTNSAGLKLWELPGPPTGTSCFKNCTGLSDYADIPAGWK